MCTNNQCDSETHFLLNCNYYKEFRNELILKGPRQYPLFIYASETVKLNILMENEHIRDTAKYIYKAFIKRKNALYNLTVS
jgi:hypothetical protein